MLVLYIIRNGNYLILGAPYWIYSIPLYFTYPSKKNILLKWLSEKKDDTSINLQPIFL